MTSESRPPSLRGRRLFCCVSLSTAVLVAIVLRLHALDSQGLWYDEILTALRAQENLNWLLFSEPLRSWPLHYLCTKLSFALFGQSDFTTRLPAAFAGIVSIALIFRVGKILFGRREGMIAVVLLTLSPLHVHASRDARYYALSVLFCLAAVLFLWRAVRTGKKRYWAGLVVAILLGLYNHPSILLLLAAVLIFLFVVVVYRLARISGYLPGNGRRAQGSLASVVCPLACALVSGMIACLYLLGLPGGMSSTLIGQDPDLAPIVQLSTSFFVGLADTLGSGPGLISIVFLATLLLGLVFSLRSTPLLATMLTLMFVIPVLVLPLIRLRIFFVYKYLIFMLPAYLLLVSKGVTALFDLVQELTMRGEERHFWPAILPWLLVLCALASFEGRGALQQLNNETEQWREIGSFLQQHALPKDLIVVPPMIGPLNAPSSSHVLDYYWPTASGPRLQILHSGDDIHALCALQEGIWLVLTPPYTGPVAPSISQFGNLPDKALEFYPDFRILHWDCSRTEVGG